MDCDLAEFINIEKKAYNVGIRLMKRYLDIPVYYPGLTIEFKTVIDNSLPHR